MKVRFIDSITQVAAVDWNALLPGNYPFARHEFLHALEQSGAVCAATGWVPQHLIIESDGALAGGLPLYRKSHSYGEYVFDWQWAQAFASTGQNYYPKLLCAIPFTPASGPRMLRRPDLPPGKVWQAAAVALDARLAEQGLSGWHLLFADASLQKILAGESDLLRREDVQFHWFNRAADGTGPAQKYRDFAHFLAGLRASKRKQIRRERRRVAEQGIVLHRLCGEQIKDCHWRIFYACYQATYLKRSGHGGYLNRDFFAQLRASLGTQCMLVLASIAEQPVAAALSLFDEHRLYGRHWGALGDYDCLHFEACYYQGIEFAIAAGLDCFDPGPQGEHKLLRGFTPVKTHSYHHFADPNFSRAVGHFLQRERDQVDQYQSAAHAHLPFRAELT
ncbi:MAG: N-acetyltransferase [Cellvibrionales bacterium]|nr:N-acetyltransferase [Cellvibrionales bacterium]